MPAYFIQSLMVSGVSLIAFWLAWHFYRKNNSWAALLCILAAGLAFRLFADADGYLHEWDERFHALVAKNLLAHPMIPTLVDHPAVAFGPESWCCNHVWLNKPPLPLWLMAGSIGLFGANEWALRLPSLLLSMGAIWLTFLMGRSLFDTRTGLYAAFLHAVNGKLMELAAGRISSDHVETCHVVMFQLGMWFVLRNWQGRGRCTPVWIGVFTGLAFLSKWMPAVFIPAIWFLGVLWLRRPFFPIVKQGVIIGLVSLGIIAPWLWYIWKSFPVESKWLLETLISYNGEIVEDHSGPWYFYLDAARIMFGELVYLPLLGGLLALIRRPSHRGLGLWAVALWIVVPLLALSAATTKRETYLLVAAPAFFLLIAFCVRWCGYQFYHRPKWRAAWVLLWLGLLLLPLRYGMERIKLFVPRERRPEWRDRLESYANQVRADGPADGAVIFLADHPEGMMFYYDITAYGVLPESATRDSLRQNGWRVYVMGKEGLRRE